MQSILKYFPNLSDKQRQQFAALGPLYADWNAKINVISRKDIDNLYLHHVLHSLAIERVIRFSPDTTVIDVGTGGGFPGVPLAILFPECRFTLVDSVGKKLRVAGEVASAIGLDNVEFVNDRVENLKNTFDFVVSRAAMDLSLLARLTRKNIRRECHNGLPNGIICLKGGDLTAEVAPFFRISTVYNLSDWFDEDFFSTKKAIYLPLCR